MNKIVHGIKRSYFRLIASQARPIMMYYHYNFQGEKCENIRISTSTFLDDKKNLKIGNHCYIGHYNFIEASNGIKIEEGVQITNYCSITSHSSHHSIRLYGKKYVEAKNPIGYVKGEIKIGKYTFEGPHSVIMPKTNIGKGCIIGAFSYLQGHYPDFSIILGNPGKVIGNTQKMDQRILDRHPELKEYYQEWSTNT